ncbi:BnaC06g25070D [Brassica napus]|uniref:BnaC06g25070D protein n=1 Tax=Brassica napus TaxID=3708 RepID=A0A078GG34_BRANA|nr:BnaC06g25070D [Brassica napus]
MESLKALFCYRKNRGWLYFGLEIQYCHYVIIRLRHFTYRVSLYVGASRLFSGSMDNSLNVTKQFMPMKFQILIDSDFSCSTFNGAYLEKAVAYKDNFSGSFLLAAAEKGQQFVMPLLRIALQAFKDKRLPLQLTSQKYRTACGKGLKRFNSEEAIEYGLIIVRPPRIKDEAPLQDETSGLG